MTESVAKPGAARRLLTNASAGAVQALISGLVLFGLYRILLTRLGAERVGLWSLLMAWLSLARIADLGLPGAIVRFAAPAFGSGNKVGATRLLTRSVLATCGMTAGSNALFALALLSVSPAFLANEREAPRLVAQAALVSWLFCVTVALRAGLDSLQRVDLRHGTMILQNVVYLGAAFVLVRDGRIDSLLVTQALSLSVTATFTLALLARELRQRPQRVAVSSAAPLREVLGYGLGFQATTLSSLVLDPLIKQLLGHYANLSSVTWYEMSSKVVTQVRAIVHNAMEGLVPHVAAKGEAERASLDREYLRVFRINLGLISLGIGVLVVNAPLLSLLWLGRYETTFVLFTALLSLAWWINTLCVPAYFVAQGLGMQRFPVLNHVVTAGIAAALSIPLGSRYGGMGVMLALVVGMLVSTQLLIVGMGRALSRVAGRPVRARIPLVYGLLAIALSLLVSCTSATWSLRAYAGLGILGSLLVAVVLWRENRAIIPRFARTK